ncbi:hypothetical protein H6G04_28660 [Calothrix membranacea FACHB-236]|nr:hypothetical protein [Calothrix membranacea FACHB-236]
MWDINKCIHLRTSGDRYPLWWTDTAIEIQSSAKLAEYKYVRLDAKGNGQWEALGPCIYGQNMQPMLNIILCFQIFVQACSTISDE